MGTLIPNPGAIDALNSKTPKMAIGHGVITVTGGVNMTFNIPKPAGWAKVTVAVVVPQTNPYSGTNPAYGAIVADGGNAGNTTVVVVPSQSGLFEYGYVLGGE